MKKAWLKRWNRLRDSYPSSSKVIKPNYYRWKKQYTFDIILEETGERRESGGKKAIKARVKDILGAGKK